MMDLPDLQSVYNKLIGQQDTQLIARAMVDLIHAS